MPSNPSPHQVTKASQNGESNRTKCDTYNTDSECVPAEVGNNRSAHMIPERRSTLSQSIEEPPTCNDAERETQQRNEKREEKPAASSRSNISICETND